MARRKKQEEQSPGSPAWLTTYSDLVTLLLCFFVLLFSFSTVDAQKFKAIMSSFQGGSGVLDGGTVIDPPMPVDEEEEVESDLMDLVEYLEEYAETLGLGNKIAIEIEERGIVVRFMDDVFFDSGSAKIKTESFKILKEVAELLNREEFVNRQIRVEGHTDSDPILRSSKYPTNWELSSDRATNVLRYLVEIELMDGERVSSSNYSYYRPIVPNDTPENKARNRRVDIIILKDIYQELEP